MRTIAVGHVENELMRMGDARRRLYLLKARGGVTVTNVVFDTAEKQCGRL